MRFPKVLTRRRFLAGAAGSAALRALPPGGARAGTLAPAAPRAIAFDLAIGPSRFRADAAGRLVSEALTAPGRFDLAGARWRAGPPHVHAELRGRLRDGTWSPWTRAPLLHGHAPDGGTRESGTDGVWFGGADVVQVRLSAPVEGLRLHFVNATGTATAAARRASRAWRARAAAARTPVAEAAVSGTPHIIPRKTWDPHNQCKPRVKPEIGAVALAFVHHTVSANGYGPEDAAAIVLSIGLYHRNTNGWNDIGYNFLVDRYGQIFEGRAGGVTKAIIGAQAQGFNYTSTGVANIGTFDAVGQTPKGLASLANLIGWKLALHGTPATGTVRVVSAGGETNRYRSGTPVTLHRVAGHRDVDATDCPGEDLYSQLDRLRAMVAARKRTQPATSIVLTPPAGPVRAGGSVLLRGRVLVDGSPPPTGSDVDLQTVEDTLYATVTTVATGSDGAFSARIPLTASTTFRAVFDPTGEAPLHSDNVLAAAAPALTLTARRPSVKTGRTVSLGVGSHPVARPLSLLLERRVGGRWRVLRRRTLRSRATATRITLPFAGAYRARVEWAGSDELAAAHSAWVALRASGAGPGGASA